MRFVFGMLPDDPALDPAAEGWNRVASSATNRLSQLFIFPEVGVAVFFAALIAWSVWVPDAWQGNFTQAYPWGSFIICLVIGIFIHEFLHLVTHPFFGLSKQSVVGIWPKMLAPYVLFDGPITRNRLVLVILTPFVVLSVIPFLIAISTGYSNPYVALIAILNASGSVWDIHRAFIVITCIPADAVVRGHSDHLWWHKIERRYASKLS